MTLHLHHGVIFRDGRLRLVCLACRSDERYPAGGAGSAFHVTASRNFTCVAQQRAREARMRAAQVQREAA